MTMKRSLFACAVVAAAASTVQVCLAEKDSSATPCVFVGPKVGFLRGCHNRCQSFRNVADAQAACAPESGCAGLTFSSGAWELRSTRGIQQSNHHEISIEKVCGYSSGSQALSCGRAGSCLCKKGETQHCCGDGICDGPECYHTCFADCSSDPKHEKSCLFDLLHVSVEEVSGLQPECREGACDCRDDSETLCCGDGECTDVECDKNCPQDCGDLPFRKQLCRAEKQTGLDEDFASPVPEVDPPLDDREFQRLLQLSDAEMDGVGFDVNGYPSIFVSIASFRDDLCRNTIEDALRRASHPERLFFGVVEQKMATELDCLPSKQECSKENPRKPFVCNYVSQVRVYTVDARRAAGPTWARHRTDRLYRGETYVVQIDSHMLFTIGWDSDIIDQFAMTNNDYAVLTSYPTDTKGHITRGGIAKTQSVPVICGATLVPGDGVLRNNGALEVKVESKLGKAEPMLHPFFAAGMSLSRGHRLLRVPNDCCTPMMFMGEELSIMIRSWTRGYDFYTFARSAMFHIYPWDRTEEPPMFWENNELRQRSDDRQRSTRRLRALLGMETDGDFDATELVGTGARYGLGQNRTLEQFQNVFGIDFKKQEIENNCMRVVSGEMHKTLVRFLREDGRGIDYSEVPLRIWEIKDNEQRLRDRREEMLERRRKYYEANPHEVGDDYSESPVISHSVVEDHNSIDEQELADAYVDDEVDYSSEYIDEYAEEVVKEL